MQEKIRNILDALLTRHELCPSGGWSGEQSSADGSDRMFFRIRSATGENFIAVVPAEGAVHGMKEAEATYHFGLHFHGCGAAVPRIYAFDPESGTVVFEDLGNTLLYDLIRSRGGITPEVLQYYLEAVEKLAHLQTACRKGFQTGYCWDTPRYDLPLMLSRESGYFYDALCRNILRLGEPSLELEDNFRKIARRAAEEPADYILHRDFQCRNLMINRSGLGIIDFQGARLGPLAYDLASLLIDPYADLPADCRRKIMHHYLEALRAYIPLDPLRFVEGYYYLALQRNLQILGAFSYLSRQKGKIFFQQFIRPAAANLQLLLGEEEGRTFSALACLTERIISRINTGALDQSS